MVPLGNQGNLRFFPDATLWDGAFAILKTLEVVPRAKFTAAAPRTEKLLPMGTIQRVTVHHTGFPEPWLEDDFAVTAHHLEQIRQLHTDPAGRNWADIAYHYAVDRIGRVWQLRDLQFQGAHVKHHNHNNIGIVTLGNFDVQEPSEAQITALIALLDFIVSAYGLSGISTHRQLADTPTSCPGKHLRRLLDQHAENLQKRLP